MSITTKLARRYECEQVMPVPVMKRKLLCEQCPTSCTTSCTTSLAQITPIALSIAPITPIAPIASPPSSITEYSYDAHVIPGSIVTYTETSIPDGYYLCDGSYVSRTVDSILFQAIGTFYGNGDGSTTFGLPNLMNGEQNHYLIKR